MTAAFLPLMPEGVATEHAPGSRIVAVSSELAHSALGSMSAELRKRFEKATQVSQVDALLAEYRAAAADGDKRKAQGWSQSHYGVSKAGVCAWTRALSKELAPKGITVNCACPGWCHTDMTSSMAPRTAAEGASMIVHVCNLPQGDKTTGEFWRNKKVAPLFD